MQEKIYFHIFLLHLFLTLDEAILICASKKLSSIKPKNFSFLSHTV